MLITVEFDTKDKSLVVMKDGKKLSNVVDVNFYRSFDDEKVFRAIISQRTPNDDEGVMVVTTTMANEDGKVTETVDEKGQEELTENLAKLLFDRISK